MNCTNTGTGGTVQNLVYLNKIFHDRKERSCPLIFAFASTPDDFTQTLNIRERGCCCSTTEFPITTATTFRVTNSCVVVNNIELDPTTALTPADVTVSGFPVTDLDYMNGRFYGDLSGIMADITRCPCDPIDRHLCHHCNACGTTCGSSCGNACGTTGNNYPCTCNDCPGACDNNGHFVLIESPGPWAAALAIVLEGTVTNGSRTGDFKLCLRPAVTGTGTETITITGTNNFGLNCVEIPCQADGIAPTLVFDFSACANLLNPTVTVTTTADPDPTTEITVAGSLILTPSVRLQVVRPSLFALDASEVPTCCDDLGQCNESCGWNGICGCGNPNCDGSCGWGRSHNDCGCDSRRGRRGPGSCGCGNPNCDGSCGWGRPHNDCGCGNGFPVPHNDCGCGSPQNDCGCGCQDSRPCPPPPPACPPPQPPACPPPSLIQPRTAAAGDIACQCCSTNGYRF